MLLVVATLWVAAKPARADDPPEYLISGPYFSLTAVNTASDLELGMAFAATPHMHLRPYAVAPFSDSASQLVRIDGTAQAARVGLGVDYLMDWTGMTGPASFLVLSAQAELGTSVYDYSPTSAMQVSERHQSFSGQVQGRFGVLWPRSLQIAPQVSVVYDRSYVAADAVGLVIPGSSGRPDMVQMTVVDPPTATPALTLRVGTPWYDGKLHAPVGFGTYVVASFAGAADRYQPWGNGDTVRGELWTYLFVTKPTYARAGLALFAESTHVPGDTSSMTSYGLLVQLRANTTLFEY